MLGGTRREAERRGWTTAARYEQLKGDAEAARAEERTSSQKKRSPEDTRIKQRADPARSAARATGDEQPVA